MDDTRPSHHAPHDTPKKNRVFRLLDNRDSCAEAGRKENVPARTVRDWKKKGTQRRQYKGNSGRKKKLNASHWQRIKRHTLHKYNKRTLSYRSIIKELELPYSIDNLRRFYYEHNYHKCRACSKPYISPHAREKRYAFAKEYKDWKEEDWEKVTFTNEVSFETGKRARDWVIRTTGEQYCLDCIQWRFRSGSKSTMAWGAIGSLGQPDMVFLKGSGARGGVTMDDYIDQVLEAVLIPAFDELSQHMPDACVMEDNAPIHGSGKAQTLGDFKKQRGLKFIIFPPCSPDLNPIENVCRAVKQRLKRLKRMPQSRQELEEAVQRIWRECGPEIWSKYIKSMPKRLEAVRKAKGLQTRY